MELNKSSKVLREKVVNPEGSIVLGRTPEIQLYLEASNLKIKEDEFYQSAEGKLSSFLTLAQELSIRNPEYVLGLAKFMSDNGLKLSPVVLCSALSNDKYELDNDDRKHLLQIFNTPQRIAEAIGLQNIKLVHLNNSFKKHILKVALENMSAYTLQKNKMSNRKIKTKDLIKLLRPLPKDSFSAKLYQDIIEDGILSKLKEQTLVSVKSDDKLSMAEKKKYYQENIDRIPINMLIRNLRFIVENFDFKDGALMQIKVIEKLNSVTDYRFLNIFDVITAARELPQLEKALFEVVNKFCNDVKDKFDYHNISGTVLYDFSGSMDGKGIEDGFKYLVLMSLIFDKLNIKCFSNDLSGSVKLDSVITDIRKGLISRAYTNIKSEFRRECGGTALLRCTKQLLNEQSEIKNLIIISDEVSWEEGSDLTGAINSIHEKMKGRNLILINPSVYKGTVFKENMVAFASLTSAIVYNMMLVTNQQSFINYIKNYGREGTKENSSRLKGAERKVDKS